ncbi:putative phage abortive infection protein [Acinetobacter baumannii]|nr:putative phage abortive infection protein [Acinetobacter baumannii]MDN8162140.1 putative phage abortive infection protein [Acinetobacter baumannii]
MQEIENNSNKDLEKIDQDINFHRIIIFLIIIAVVFFYLIMKEVKVSDAAQHWGPVGDFFGGILNPIFALFAFYWLTYSVRLQIKELKETREELKKAAAAQVESASHQQSIAELENENVITQKELLALQEKTLLSQQLANKAQQQQIEIQNFESLFFELIKTKNNSISMMKTYEIDSNSSTEVHGLNVFETRLGYLKQNDNFDYDYKKYSYDIFASYIRICDQILILLVDSKSKFKNINTYINIFKATLSRVELELIFINGFIDCNLKENIEQTSLFEGLNPNYEAALADKNFLTRNAFFYNSIAFGKNEDWEVYFKEFSLCKIDSVDINIIKDQIAIIREYLTPYTYDLRGYFVIISREKLQELVADKLVNLRKELNINKINLSQYKSLKDINITDELFFILKYYPNFKTQNKF